MQSRPLIALCALSVIAGPALAQRPAPGQASLTLTNHAAVPCLHNDTEWSLSKSHVLIGNTVGWTVTATRGATTSDTLQLNGYIEIKNTGTANATIGNCVLNLQHRIGNNWVSAAADVADATNGDGATGANIVASASTEVVSLNTSVGPSNYSITGARGRFIETPGSGALNFTDASNNTVFSLVPQINLPPNQTIQLLYVATFDNTILGLLPGAPVRAEFIVSFGNSGARGGSGASANDIDVNGNGNIDNDEHNVRSVPSRDTVTVPALEHCNDPVTLSDLPGDIVTTGDVQTSNFLTTIGGGTGTEVINTTAVRIVSVDVSFVTGGNLNNCAHLAGADSSVSVPGPINPVTGLPSVFYTFECCRGIRLQACDPLNFTGSQPRVFCTYTQGGYGAQNPHTGAPVGFPANLLASNFGAVYPTGVEVGIPGASGYSLRFTSSAAVLGFLPSGGAGGPGVLTGDLINPISSSSNVFGGQVLALQINVDFSSASVTTPGFGGLLLCGTGTSLDGQTVALILAAANTALGGGSLPAGFTVSTLNDLVTNLNEAFDNCVVSGWALLHLCGQ